MQQTRPFWFLLDVYGWIVFIMSVITAVIIQQWWVILIGMIGYLLALLLDLVGGRALGRTGAMRLARAEQENLELKAEQARLLGAIHERDEKLKEKTATSAAAQPQGDSKS